MPRTLMSESTFRRLWPGRSLHPTPIRLQSCSKEPIPTPIRLQSCSKEPIPVLGCCNVNIDYQGQTAELPLVIVEGAGPTLLGRDWLSYIRLNWREIHHVHSASLQSVLSRSSYAGTSSSDFMCTCIRYLKSEMHNRLHTARFSVILEAYLKGCGESCLV